MIRLNETDTPQQAEQRATLNLAANSRSPVLSLINWAKQKKYLVLMLSLLFALIYYVFLVLPHSVTIPKIRVDTDQLIVQEIQKPIDESPWHETQLAKYRKESQAILAQVLTQQQALEQKQVHRWAEQEFKQALKLAETGDVLYRQQKFEQAKAQYQQSFADLTKLVQQIPSVLALYLSKAEQALTTRQHAEALEFAQIALYLAPDSENAQQLMHQASVFAELQILIEQGNVYRDELQLTQAKQKYEQALALDPFSALAKNAVNEINQRLVNDRYSKAMSAGYQFLASKQYPLAIAQFKQAKQSKPTAKDPDLAIEQVNNEQLQVTINQLLSLAQQQEQQEAWQQAKQGYEQVLQLDSSLMLARVGVIRTSARASLDEQLQAIIEQPSRLTNQGVYQQAQQTYQNALTIKSAGNKLSQQISQVNHLLNTMLTQITVHLESDSLTQISIFRVGDFGTFTQKTIELSPGQYTAIGTRVGYRDVQQQFELKPNDNNKIIRIFCREKVTNG